MQLCILNRKRSQRKSVGTRRNLIESSIFITGRCETFYLLLIAMFGESLDIYNTCIWFLLDMSLVNSINMIIKLRTIKTLHYIRYEKQPTITYGVELLLYIPRLGINYATPYLLRIQMYTRCNSNK